MSARGARYASPEIIGASIFQTPGGIQSELAKIDGEIMAMDAEITTAVKAHGGIVPATLADAVRHGMDIASGKAKAPPVNNKLDAFYQGAWIPFVASWKTWYEDSNGWVHNFFWNEAPDGEAFQRKLLAMRDAAQAAGLHIQTPAPDIEGMSILDPRKAGIGDALDQVAKVGKIALWGGLVLGGAFVIVKIVEVARK